jgi:hypothetical protein
MQSAFDHEEPLLPTDDDFSAPLLNESSSYTPVGAPPSELTIIPGMNDSVSFLDVDDGPDRLSKLGFPSAAEAIAHMYSTEFPEPFVERENSVISFDENGLISALEAIAESVVPADVVSLSGGPNGFVRLVWDMRSPALAAFFTYVVTLSIFPGFLSEDVTSKALGDWYPLLLFLTFSVNDYLSRGFSLRGEHMVPLSILRCDKSRTILSSSLHRTDQRSMI